MEDRAYGWFHAMALGAASNKVEPVCEQQHWRARARARERERESVFCSPTRECVYSPSGAGLPVASGPSDITAGFEPQLLRHVEWLVKISVLPLLNGFLLSCFSSYIYYVNGLCVG